MAADLSYFVYEDGYIPVKDYHAGFCDEKHPLEIKVQVWNNRWGVTDVDPVNNALLTLEFSDFEDVSLLACCSVIVGSTISSMKIANHVGSVILGKTLSGTKNDGDPDNINNMDNYINITVMINIKDKEVKENDLKKLFLTIKELE